MEKEKNLILPRKPPPTRLQKVFKTMGTSKMAHQELGYESNDESDDDERNSCDMEYEQSFIVTNDDEAADSDVNNYMESEMEEKEEDDDEEDGASSSILDEDKEKFNSYSCKCLRSLVECISDKGYEVVGNIKELEPIIDDDDEEMVFHVRIPYKKEEGQQFLTKYDFKNFITNHKDVNLDPSDGIDIEGDSPYPTVLMYIFYNEYASAKEKKKKQLAVKKETPHVKKPIKKFMRATPKKQTKATPVPKKPIKPQHKKVAKPKVKAAAKSREKLSKPSIDCMKELPPIRKLLNVSLDNFPQKEDRTSLAAFARVKAAECISKKYDPTGEEGVLYSKEDAAAAKRWRKKTDALTAAIQHGVMNTIDDRSFNKNVKDIFLMLGYNQHNFMLPLQRGNKNAKCSISGKPIDDDKQRCRIFLGEGNPDTYPLYEFNLPAKWQPYFIIFWCIAHEDNVWSADANDLTTRLPIMHPKKKWKKIENKGAAAIYETFLNVHKKEFKKRIDRHYDSIEKSMQLWKKLGALSKE